METLKGLRIKRTTVGSITTRDGYLLTTNCVLSSSLLGSCKNAEGKRLSSPSGSILDFLPSPSYLATNNQGHIDATVIVVVLPATLAAIPSVRPGLTTYGKERLRDGRTKWGAQKEIGRKEKGKGERRKREG
jgi:hypothetical protein